MLAYLLVEANRPHSRNFLATLLWGDQPDQKARTNLRTTFAKLRQLLAPLETETPLFTTTRQSIQLNLNPAQHWVDVAVFNDLLTGCEGDPVDIPACAQAMAQAVALYRGEFSSDLMVEGAETFEAWRLEQQEKYHMRVLSLFNCLAGYYMQDAYHQLDFQLAEKYARQQLALEPWHEIAHYQLMEILAKTGQKTAALAQYETCRRLLAEELGAEPSPQTVALAGQILRDELRTQNKERGAGRETSSRIGLDWSEAPLTGAFFGRAAELAQLQQWLVDDRCRLVSIFGMGGLGKTALAAQAARTVANQFELIIWRSLLNAPTLDELLPGVLSTLAGEPLANIPQMLDEKLALLRHYLQQKRSLLVLDNLETILQSESVGHYRPGYENYGQLIEYLGRYDNAGCLLLTSRERPQGLIGLEQSLSGVQSLSLTGLKTVAGQEILQTHGLSLKPQTAAAVTQRYSGNPLALKLVAETIRDIYFGDVEAFLGQETPIFADIRDVLDQQFSRLSPLGQDVLLWLAIAREALSPPELSDLLVRHVRQRDLLELLRNLQHRSLLERGSNGFILQNVVMEYLTDYLVDQAGREIEHEQLKLLHSHALLQAQTKAYVRQSQARLILQPVAQHLTANLGLKALDAISRRLLDTLREAGGGYPSYAGGNILNLLLHLKINTRGYDFSRIKVWQAYLQNVQLHSINFAGSNFNQSVFADTFDETPAVGFSPDGKIVAAGANDGHIRLWQAVNGRPIGVIPAHASTVRTLAFSPDGQFLASGSFDHTVRLWDARTWQPRHILRGHADAVLSVAFSADSRTLASGSADCTVRLWQIETGQCDHILRGHTGWVYGLAFSPDGQTVATGSDDHTVRLWDVPTKQPGAILKGHKAGVLDVAISPDGQILASGSADQTVCLWWISGNTSPERENCHILQGHTNSVAALAFSRDGRFLVSGGYDHTAHLWDISELSAHNQADNVPAKAHLRHILRADDWIEDVAFSPDGQTLATGSLDRTVRLFNVASGQLQQLLQGVATTAYSVAFSPDGQTLAGGSADGTVCLWYSHTGEVRHILPGHTYLVRSVAFSPDGQTLASGSEDKTVRLWEVDTGQLRQILQGYSDRITAVAFSPDGARLASSSDDGTVNIWDVAAGQLRHSLPGHSERVTSVAFSPDGQLLASGSNDRTVQLWQVDTLETKPAPHILMGHTDWIRAIAFSPNGQLLASASTDYTVRLWGVVAALETGGNPTDAGLSPDDKIVQHILSGHTNWVNAIAFHPDGQLLASGSSDHTVRLWNVTDGQEHNLLEGHTHWVMSVAFSPDGKTLATGSGDETVRLWDVRSGACLKTLRIPGPYAGMNISGVTGITEAQRSALKALGAVG
ncbi:MAG: NB-ARC domain-containing protein [Anaerolineae bacterium]